MGFLCFSCKRKVTLTYSVAVEVTPELISNELSDPPSSEEPPVPLPTSNPPSPTALEPPPPITSPPSSPDTVSEATLQSGRQRFGFKLELDSENELDQSSSLKTLLSTHDPPPEPSPPSPSDLPSAASRPPPSSTPRAPVSKSLNGPTNKISLDLSTPTKSKSSSQRGRRRERGRRRNPNPNPKSKRRDVVVDLTSDQRKRKHGTPEQQVVQKRGSKYPVISLDLTSPPPESPKTVKVSLENEQDQEVEGNLMQEKLAAFASAWEELKKRRDELINVSGSQDNSELDDVMDAGEDLVRFVNSP
ncbi:hypothetical protein P9112_014587 [Eukaryota sp. TZLM1-RC]